MQGTQRRVEPPTNRCPRSRTRIDLRANPLFVTGVGGGLEPPNLRPGGIYSRLADVGHGPVRFAEEVATRMPTPEEARFLRLTDPQPVFNLFRTAFDVSGAPVEVCEHVMSGDRWLLTYEWAAE
jgi:GntR family transcriptional regulator